MSLNLESLFSLNQREVSVSPIVPSGTTNYFPDDSPFNNGYFTPDSMYGVDDVVFPEGLVDSALVLEDGSVKQSQDGVHYLGMESSYLQQAQTGMCLCNLK